MFPVVVSSLSWFLFDFLFQWFKHYGFFYIQLCLRCAVELSKHQPKVAESFVTCIASLLSESQGNILTTLTLNLLNFLNGIIHLPVLEMSIINFRNIKMRTWSWTANSIEPCQTPQMCRVAWLYTGGKSWSLSYSGVMVNTKVIMHNRFLSRYCHCICNTKTLN